MDRSERLVRIERALRNHRSVAFDELREQLGISRPTLYRDIAYLRDRMGVPVEADAKRRHYCLNAGGGRYEMPSLWFNADEILALLSMQRLLADLDPGGLLGPHLAPLQDRLVRLLESADDPAEVVAHRIRVLAVAARGCASGPFQQVAQATMQRKRLSIVYLARSSGETSEREISPQRLVHYRGNWHLDAWCHWRDQLRNFAVDAIASLRVLETPARDIPEAELDLALGAGYGIFAGAEVQWATLVFTAERARWVACERWHPEQQGAFLDDGSYQLRLPYSNDPELIMDILKYGPDCEVVGPAGLREKVVGLLKAAVGRYGDE
jgi:predicted DNA-binding transcriptional regulator YafY